MGFEKKSVSVSRFIAEEHSLTKDQIRDILTHNAFVPVESVEPVKGCVGVLDIGDTNFSFDPILDNWVVFGIRCDTRSVPKPLVNLKLKEKIEAILANNGTVGRAQKKGMKEEIEVQLKMRALPSPAMKCVAWNLETNEVWYEGTSSKLQDEFEAYFDVLFGLKLQALGPESKAYILAPDKEKDITQFEAYGDVAANDCDEAISRDFMLWLWYESSCNTLRAEDQNGRPCGVYVDDSISLANEESKVSFSSSKESENFDEARQSVHDHGRSVSQLSLLYSILDREESWKGTLCLGSLTPKSIKKPQLTFEDGDDEAAQLLLHLDSVQTVIHVTDALFAQFLSIRLSDAWEAKIQDIQDWVQENG